jgi:hypothetical protein
MPAAAQEQFTGRNMPQTLAFDTPAVAASGAGFLPDLARTCIASSITFGLDDVAMRNSGAGSVQDLLRMAAAGV